MTWTGLENFDRVRDRRDPKRAKQLFELLWPDQVVRDACAARLAQSIRRAHRRADASWEVTMFADRIRLNVGQVEVLTLTSNSISVLFQEAIETPLDTQLTVERSDNDRFYDAVTVPSARCRLAPLEVGTAPRSLWFAHEAFIDAAADAKRISPFKNFLSVGVLEHLDAALGAALPRPTYLRAPLHVRQAADWRADVRSWVTRFAGRSDDPAPLIERFFERAFESTRCLHEAWFGVHQGRASLVVGGIFLAAVLRTGRDRGVWLLVDEYVPPVDGVAYHPVKSTKRSKFPLTWAHSQSLDTIHPLVVNDDVWASYAAASEKILHAPSAGARDEMQERRGKTRLSEILSLSGKSSRQDVNARPTASRTAPPTGGGYGDAEQNAKVERAAVDFVTRAYRREGWKVTSVEAKRCGYDLCCQRDGEEFHVEVKGSSGSERRFLMTSGEWWQAESDRRFVLALVTNALSEFPTMERWSALQFLEKFDIKPIQYVAAWRIEGAEFDQRTDARTRDDQGKYHGE